MSVASPYYRVYRHSYSLDIQRIAANQERLVVERPEMGPSFVESREKERLVIP